MQFLELRLRALQECPSSFAASYEEEAKSTLVDIDERLAARPESVVFGAFDETRLVGICGLQRERLTKLAHKANIWGMYVSPEARCVGYGLELIQTAIAHARAMPGVHILRLGVNTENGPAIALYERAGFRVTATEEGYLMVDGVLHSEHQMAKEISEVA